jgi:hypothetical protein
MVATIAAIFGVPLWLVLGWEARTLWHRREIKKLQGLFKTKVRLVSGTYRHTDSNYPRTAAHAVWAHDILILEKGLLLPRVLHFRAAEGVQSPKPADPDQVKGLGHKPVTMQYRLDDGEVIEIAAQSEDLADAQGPFFSDTDQ